MNARSQPTLSVVTEKSLDNFALHLQAWDKLAWEAPQAIPTLLPDWIKAYLNHRLSPEEGWFCSFAYRGDELVGVLPVVVTPHRLFGRSRPFLRTPFCSVTNSGDILLSQEIARDVLVALLREVEHQEPAYLELEFSAVRSNSPLLHAMRTKLRTHTISKGKTLRYFRADLTSPAEVYLAGLGSLRRNIKRYRKKLDGKGSVKVELMSGSDASVGFLSEFLTLEASGWKGREKSAILLRPSETAFYTSVVEAFGEKGRLEWHIIRLDSRVIAAQMGIRCGSTLMLPRIAYDEQYADCMPGSLLTGEVMTDVHNRKELTQLHALSEAEWLEKWGLIQEDFPTVHLVRKNAFTTLFHRPFLSMRLLWVIKLRPLLPTHLKARLKNLISTKVARILGQP